MASRTPFKATAVVAALSLVLALFSAPAALAAPILPNPTQGEVTAVTTLTKTAAVKEIAPGDTFFYTLTVGCSTITDLGCRDAVLSDQVPAPFVLVSATVGAGVNTAAEPVISGNSVRVDWTTPLGTDATGLLDATTAIVQIEVRLPADVSHDVSGIEVFNSAYIEGTNFVDVGASAGVTPIVPLQLATTATKALSPTSSLALPGTAVTATLGGSNDSNGTVERLTIQDPVDPTANPHPFDYLGFSGFGALTPPAGATGAPLYEVFVGGTWVAVPGGVLPGATLPSDVRGARVTFAGAIPAGATASVALDLALTDLAQTQSDGFVVANTVRSEVGVGSVTATDDASATLTLLQNDIQVAATKSFDPALVVAGDDSTVTLGATNRSAVPIESLSLREPATGTFPTSYTFAGIDKPIGYPQGATSGNVIYHRAGGGTETVPFADGARPAPPTGQPTRSNTSRWCSRARSCPAARRRFHSSSRPIQIRRDSPRPSRTLLRLLASIGATPATPRRPQISTSTTRYSNHMSRRAYDPRQFSPFPVRPRR